MKFIAIIVLLFSCGPREKKNDNLFANRLASIRRTQFRQDSILVKQKQRIDTLLMIIEKVKKESPELTKK